MEPIILIAGIALIVLGVVVFLDGRSRIQFEALQEHVLMLQDQLSKLSDGKPAGRQFTNNEKVNLEDLIAMQININTLMDAIEENAEAVRLQAERVKDRANKTYQMMHYLRGLDRTNPDTPPDLSKSNLQG